MKKDRGKKTKLQFKDLSSICRFGLSSARAPAAAAAESSSTAGPPTDVVLFCLLVLKCYSRAQIAIPHTCFITDPVIPIKCPPRSSASPKPHHEYLSLKAGVRRYTMSLWLTLCRDQSELVYGGTLLCHIVVEPFKHYFPECFSLTLPRRVRDDPARRRCVRRGAQSDSGGLHAQRGGDFRRRRPRQRRQSLRRVPHPRRGRGGASLTLAGKHPAFNPGAVQS